MVGANRCSSSTSGCGDGCHYRGKNNGTSSSSGGVNFRNSSSSSLNSGGNASASGGEQQSPSEPCVYLAESASSHNILANATTASVDVPDSSESDDASLALDNAEGDTLLCLDGGGIRGLILAQLMRAIERRLIQHEQQPQAQLVDYFDWVSGTSTGANLRVGCWALAKLPRIWPLSGSRPYAADFLEQTLQEMFGENTVMTDIPLSRCGIMVHALLAGQISRRCCTLSATTIRLCPTLSRSSLRPEVAVCRPEDQLLTAYYKKNYNQLPKLRCVVSLGTGRIPTFRGMNSLAQIMVEQATSADYQTVRRAQAWCDCLGARYYRTVAANLGGHTPRLQRMLWETEVYLARSTDKLDQLVRVLTAPHRRLKLLLHSRPSQGRLDA
uniref:PNPLA domain-containing protein n=1 Tax=Macrostomum lignano TaxID=282301 RepID=A0A1I8F9A0_9PLAT